MKITCVQLCFIPYIGYFQLINAVDKFVILDDFQYITRSWINRNKVMINVMKQWITILIKNASRSKKINEVEISE